jgi:hypothetical protein
MKGAVFVLVLASLTGIAATIPPQQQTWSFPDTGFYRRATIQYRSQGVQVLVNYDYSQRNHNTKWLPVDGRRHLPARDHQRGRQAALPITLD